MKYGAMLEATPTRVYDYEAISGSVDGGEYPEVFELAKRAKVEDQGDKSACAAFAYATILEHVFSQRMSAPFIYSTLRGSQITFPECM